MICEPTRWCPLEDDGSLPSQFGHPAQKRTPFGNFLIDNKIFLNAIANGNTAGCPYAGVFRGNDVLDVTVTFPQYGSFNTWYCQTDPYTVCTFDVLGNVLTDLEVYHESTLGTTVEEDAYRAWADSLLPMNWKDIRSFYFFRSLREVDYKLRNILPRTMYHEMFDAFRETQNPDEPTSDIEPS